MYGSYLIEAYILDTDVDPDNTAWYQIEYVDPVTEKTEVSWVSEAELSQIPA